MIAYLWDACEPGRFYGVTDDQVRALQAAEACITSGAACGARVELARLVPGFAALTSRYERTGSDGPRSARTVLSVGCPLRLRSQHEAGTRG